MFLITLFVARYQKNLQQDHMLRSVEGAYSRISKNYTSSLCGAQEWVCHCQIMAMQKQAQASSSNSVHSRSVWSKLSKSSRGKKAKMEAELKRLAAVQENAMYESDFEKKRMEIDFKIRERVRKLKAEAAFAEQKAELIQDDDSDDLLSSNSENGSGSGNRGPPGRSTELTKIEQTELWAKSCPSVPLNDHALKEFEPTGHDHDTPKPDDDRNNMAGSKTGDAGRENPKLEVDKIRCRTLKQ